MTEIVQFPSFFNHNKILKTRGGKWGIVVDLSYKVVKVG